MSYYFIERPFRNKKIISFRKVCITLIITIICLIFFNSYIIYKGGLKERVPKILQEKLRNLKDVNFNTKGTKGNVVLLGDSHSDSIEYLLNEKLIKESFNLLRFETRIYEKNLNKYDNKTNKLNKNFKKKNLEIEEYLNEEKNLIIVIHYRWSFQVLNTLFDNEESVKIELVSLDDLRKFKPSSENINEQKRINLVKESIIFSINSLLENNHKVILVYPVPENGFNVPQLLYNKLIKTNIDAPILSTSYDVYKKRNKLIFETLDSIQNDNIYRVYPHKYLCDNQIKNRCVSNSKDTIYYHDDNHLSLQGSAYLIKNIVDIIKTINN